MQPASLVLRVLGLLTIINRVQYYEILQCSVAAQHGTKDLIVGPPAPCRECSSDKDISNRQNNRVKKVENKMSRLHNPNAASVHVPALSAVLRLVCKNRKALLLCLDPGHDHMDIWANLADNVEKRETHGMYPCSVPLYCMSGKDVTVSPYPSVRGKKATGFGTSAVNIGGYIFPVPVDDCPAASRAPVSCIYHKCRAPSEGGLNANMVCH